MRHVTGGLGLALAGAILQLGSLGSDFYQAEGEQKDAWLGIPHTSDLILLSALVTVALIALTAAGLALHSRQHPHRRTNRWPPVAVSRTLAARGGERHATRLGACPHGSGPVPAE